MERIENVKKKHHFVFQAYLSKWKENNAVWVLRDRKKLFPTGTEAIAFKNLFYTINSLNLDEKKLLDCYLQTMSPVVRGQMEFFIETYLLPIENQKILDVMKQAAIKRFGTENNIPDDLHHEISKCEQIIRVQKNNNMEDFYCDIEGELVQYFRIIDEHGIGFYYNLDRNDRFNFLSDICIQYFRTLPLKERWMKQFGDSIKKLDFAKVGIDLSKVNLENLSIFFFWHIQTSLAYSLMSKETTIALLNNNTAIPFITSDQPIINLKCDYDNDLAETTELTFFYPISPTKALVINGDNTERQIDVSEEAVREYNSAIARSSSHLIIGNEKEILRQYIK